MKRITIITDSLGFPRINTALEATWTDRLLRHIAIYNGGGGQTKSEKMYCHCFPSRGRHTTDLLKEKQDLILFQKSDVYFIQVGVVDASRRIVKRSVDTILSRLPYTKLYFKFCSKFRYEITRLYNYHYVCESKFKSNIEQIIQDIKSVNNNAKIVWIQIAPVGKYLIDKVFGIENDVNAYNEILQSFCNVENFTFLRCFDGLSKQDREKVVLEEDGHHLSEFGHDIVFKAVVDWLQI